MAVLHSPESAYAKELWKWDHTVNETNPVDGSKGLRPATPQMYPARLYKAGRIQGIPAIVEAVEVRSEAEERNQIALGFVAGGQGAALAQLEAEDLEIAKLAANRAFNERRMSEGAQREAAQVDDSTARHVPVIPETPIKRTRRTKAQMAADAAKQ